MIQVKRYYKGFSTRSYEKFGTFEIYNVECVTEDLVNSILTDLGSRIDLDDFGTRVLSIQFEPNDIESQQIIKDDITAAVAKDPRVQLLNLDILPDPTRGVIIAILKIKYLEFNVTDDLQIEITSK
jgi:phage baseplate assembly protein W